MPQLRLLEIGSIAQGSFNEFKCGLHGVTAEHVLKYKIGKRNSFCVIILRYQTYLKIYNTSG